jgi:hypothetical protein
MTKKQVTTRGGILGFLVSVLLIQSCLLFYGTPEFDIPNQTVAPGDTLTLNLIDFYKDRADRKDPSFTLEDGSVGNLSAGVYTWTRPSGDVQSYQVTIWGSNGLTEDSADFTINSP